MPNTQPYPSLRLWHLLSRQRQVDCLTSAWAYATDQLDSSSFWRDGLARFGIDVAVTGETTAGIPRTGPLLVVANHPHGILDGLLAATALSSVRTDLRIMVNHALGELPGPQQWLIGVNPFSSRRATDNITAIRRAVEWLRRGNCLVVFPAGEVSHFSFRHRRVTDEPWSTGPAFLFRRSEAHVLPLFIHGRNSLTFQILGLLGWRARFPLLVPEFMRSRGRRFTVSFGRCIQPKDLKSIGNDLTLTNQLRQAVYRADSTERHF